LVCVNVVEKILWFLTLSWEDVYWNRGNSTDSRQNKMDMNGPFHVLTLKYDLCLNLPNCRIKHIAKMRKDETLAIAVLFY
jgi:hypothetical protein